MGAPTVELTPRDIYAILERGAQERFGMSAIDMMKRYRVGDLPDPGAIADLLAYARLLRPEDPLALGAPRPRP